MANTSVTGRRTLFLFTKLWGMLMSWIRTVVGVQCVSPHLWSCLTDVLPRPRSGSLWCCVLSNPTHSHLIAVVIPGRVFQALKQTRRQRQLADFSHREPSKKITGLYKTRNSHYKTIPSPTEPTRDVRHNSSFIGRGQSIKQVVLQRLKQWWNPTVL